MKRRKDYMPRRGIHFDRKPTQGPAAGFVGSDIDVMALTGTVMTSATEDDESFRLPLVPFAGYPTTSVQASEVMGGLWDAGWLFDEVTGSLTSSFGYPGTTGVPVLMPALTASNHDYRIIGPRGDRTSDYAIVSLSGAVVSPNNITYDFSAAGYGAASRFLMTGALGFPRTSSDPGVLSSLTFGNPGPDQDLNVVFVAKHRTRPNEVEDQYLHDTTLLQKAFTDTRGWVLGVTENPLDFGTIYTKIPQTNVGGGAAASVANAYTAGCWFICAWVIDRKNGTAKIAVKDLSTGEITIGSGVSTATYTQMTGSGPMQMFGGGYNPPRNFVMSCLYMGNRSGSAADMSTDAGMTRALNGLANCILSPTNYKWSGSLDVDNSITAFGKHSETKLVNQYLLGASATGGLGYTYSSPTFPVTSSVIPSWTNNHLGHNAAFVIPTLSSSNHESQVLNAFRSGSEALETTAVPASASMYYSKRSVYSKIIAKKTASYFVTVPRPPPASTGPITLGEFVPTTFTAGLGAKLNELTGSQSGGGVLGDSDVTTPAHIYIDVPVSGKLIDIAVWIELHHVSSALPPMPLGCLSIAIKSPGINPGAAPFVYAKGVAESNHPWRGIQAYENTFTLWEGPGTANADQRIWVTDGSLTPNSIFREKFPCWDRDLSMRTVFHDGASVNNPRHNLGMHGSGNYVGSPNAALGINNAWGMATYWTGSAGGSPPAGWLTGPGGTAAENEWPTTGSNLGASHLKPVYPMLDPIETVIARSAPGVTYPTLYDGRHIDIDNLVSSRDGLRGTEISGTWKLLFTYSTGDDAAGAMELYFRQARLEITYEKNEELAVGRNVSNVSAGRAGRKLLWEISGCAGPSVVTASNYIYLATPPRAEVGRTFGIALNTGSINQSHHALIYRLTGTLADYSGSAPGWLLNNEFGMPRIPLSSASLVPPSGEDIISIHPQDVMTVRPILDGARRLSDAAKDVAPPRTRAQYIAEVNSDDDTDE